MLSKYLEYKDEIISLFWDGNGYQTIAQFIIDKYNLPVKKEALRRRIKDIIQYVIADKEIIQHNILLQKRSQKHLESIQGLKMH
jgi:hypothetical protein